MTAPRTIWGRRSSSNASKIYWLMEELGIAHEQRDAGMAYGVVDTPQYRALNPNGLVPTLQEPGGFVLWESHAIARYLAQEHGAGTSFWPADARRRALADQWMDWVSTILTPTINPLFARLVLNAGDPNDHAATAASIAATVRALELVGAALGDRAFLGGEEPGLGDIAVGLPVKRWFVQLPIERPPLPAISGYFERLCARPAYLDHVVNSPPVV